jgi:hypothetical protein
MIKTAFFYLLKIFSMVKNIRLIILCKGLFPHFLKFYTGFIFSSKAIFFHLFPQINRALRIFLLKMLFFASKSLSRPEAAGRRRTGRTPRTRPGRPREAGRRRPWPASPGSRPKLAGPGRLRVIFRRILTARAL